MDVTLIVNRLKAADTSLLEIESAAGLDAAMRANRAAPAAYVIPLSERAVQLPSIGIVEHFEHRLFGVVFVISCLSTTGDDAVVDLATVRAQVKEALIGFVPDATTGEPVTFAGGDLVQFQGDGQLWWSDEYQLKTYYRRA
ncbi:MAG: hypothetical protein PHH58_05260 [Rhodoferax sp.]|nr:hypothetical protein [Rhodoferax sp.]